MGREVKDVYIFITDENKQFYRATQQNDGSWLVSRDSQPYPIRYNPTNLTSSKIEFATNAKYFSLNRSITYPLDFVKDGAAILRYLYYFGKGVAQKAYITVVKWDGSQTPGRHRLAYEGKFDFSEKIEDPKTGTFTVPCVDDSVWGVLSTRDSVEYELDCSPSNPKAIPVLIDGVTLINRYTFQFVGTPIKRYDNDSMFVIPFVEINQDGDSYGIITKSQSLEKSPLGYPYELANASQNSFFKTLYPIQDVNIKGIFTFTWRRDIYNTYQAFGLHIIKVNKGKPYAPPPPGIINWQWFQLFSQYLVQGQKYSIPFDIIVDLEAGDEIFFMCNIGGLNNMEIIPEVSNVVITAKTTIQPQIVWCLRPLDALQQLVSKATDGRYTINSNHFTINNKKVMTSGDAIRNIPSAKLYTSFQDFFKTYDCFDFLALRSINKELFIEKAIDIYNINSTIFSIGEIIDLELSPAKEYFCNEIEVGSPKQDYRHPSGRLEVNSTNKFSIPLDNIDKKLDLVTKYRTGCYDVIFLILDYQGNSTEDNTGDKSVYVLDITDDQAAAIDDVENFVSVTFNSAPLSPYIRTPFDTDYINSTNPVIRGIAPAGSTINIYADGILDGSTVASPSGEWSHIIVTPLESYSPGVADGIHLIQASFTDLAAQNDSVTITVDTTVVSPIMITYPTNLSSLYNNKPIIEGKAPVGTNVDVYIDSILRGTVVSDQSGKWSFQSPILTNAAHVILVNNLPSSAIQITVDSNVSHPLIASFSKGFTEINNLPLIEGVAAPNTVVNLYLDYIPYISIGQVMSDANGNWSFQVVPVSYIDPVTGTTVDVTPIPNGVHTISTDLQMLHVPVDVLGYTLNRPAYTSITGVTDNTVFNTTLSPKRILLAHSPLLAAIGEKISYENIYFQKADKNANQVTVLNGVRIAERDDVPFSSLGSPMFMLENAKVKTKVPKLFNDLLTNFNNGGIIAGTYRGNNIFMMPIGNMSMAHISHDTQEWKLLVSTQTSYITLLNLYKNGTILNLMNNAIYHSDYNTLHFVEYNYTLSEKYNNKTLYQDWFEERNSQWVTNPGYIQKLQRTDTLKDQIIIKSTGAVNLRVYRCSDAVLVDTIPYVPVTPSPIALPEIVMEATVVLTNYPEGQYFFIMTAFDGAEDIMVGISERIETRNKWYGSILIESSNSINKTGFFFSSGIKTILRVEGTVKKLQPTIEHTTAIDERGDSELLHSVNSRKRDIRFGTAYGLPDYLYIKIADALGLDDLIIEGTEYTLEPSEKIEPAEEFDGHPMFYYQVNLLLRTNVQGATIPGGVGAQTGGIILVVDSQAIGLPAGSLYNIEVDNG